MSTEETAEKSAERLPEKSTERPSETPVQEQDTSEDLDLEKVSGGATRIVRPGIRG